jgi:hypothetical protein
METSLMLMLQAQAAALAPALAPARGVRPALARLLAGASRFLDGLSRRLEAAEAGAPEGALYVNGEFVGYVPGVRRL